MVEAFVDLLVFVAALLHVPSRQAVFDFPIRSRILLEHDDHRAALGHYSRDFRAGSRSSGDRDDMS
jgi:hypothetical protein